MTDDYIDALRLTIPAIMEKRPNDVPLWCRVCGCPDTNHLKTVAKDETTNRLVPVCKDHGPCWVLIPLHDSSVWTPDRTQAGKAGLAAVPP